MTASTWLRPTRPAATAAVAAALLGLLAACGDMTPPPGAAGGPTSAPVVGVDEGQSASAPSSTLPSTGTDVSAVIGSWAAQYGTARNQVLGAVAALGAAPDAAAVKEAADAALTAVGDAEGLMPCPDEATEQAYRADLAAVRDQVEGVRGTGSPDEAKSLAAAADVIFEKTEAALTEAYA